MNIVLNIDDYQAAICFEPNTKMFRGEFVELNGGAGFYASDVAALKREARISLRLFLEECDKHGVEPKKQFSANGCPARLD
ncbi:MAG: hypothetical protein ACTIKR_16885 [Advenella sp.]|uniref:Type II toxin-antitoxin system HicB family antitoxin n=1 Tax=Advenella kashmirensis TaxID=310575 RepID=A0A356LJE4_9BURK|nr:hypothetical protein [Advenella kashmirensis]